jgi:hypothetical protein
MIIYYKKGLYQYDISLFYEVLWNNNFIPNLMFH